jgi:hypothetical protein
MKFTNILLSILLAVIVVRMFRREPYTELFGFSGYTKPTGSIRLDDPRPNLVGYTKSEAKVTNDMMQKFVLLANKEISKRTGLCTYIIETTQVEKYTGSGNDIYQCMFMTVKNSGFAFGFSVSATFEVDGDVVTLKGLRSQPLDVNTVSDVSPFVNGQVGQEFVKYDLVKEKAVPTQSELESAKNNLQ